MVIGSLGTPLIDTVTDATPLGVGVPMASKLIVPVLREGPEVPKKTGLLSAPGRLTIVAVVPLKR
jgi:hypothetical protein